MMAKYPDELTCDMAETYGVFDIKRVPVKLLATLAVGLREDSRVKMARRGALVNTQTVLLAKLLDVLKNIEPDDPRSLTARCFVETTTGSAQTPQAPQEKYETFDSPEAYNKRWAEVTRK